MGSRSSVSVWINCFVDVSYLFAVLKTLIEAASNGDDEQLERLLRAENVDINCTDWVSVWLNFILDFVNCFYLFLTVCILLYRMEALHCIGLPWMGTLMQWHFCSNMVLEQIFMIAYVAHLYCFMVLYCLIIIAVSTHCAQGGMTALQGAANFGHSSVVELLLDAGAYIDTIDNVCIVYVCIVYIYVCM